MFPSKGLAAFARRSLMVTLVHEYTKASRIAGTEDAHGGSTYTAGLPETARCLYVERETMTTNERGSIAVNVPTLVIDRDDDLAAGESVTNIVDREGNVLAAGPLTVEDVKLAAAMGGLWRKQATLRGGEPV